MKDKIYAKYDELVDHVGGTDVEHCSGCKRLVDELTALKSEKPENRCVHFIPDGTSTSASKCVCGKEKWEHQPQSEPRGETADLMLPSEIDINMAAEEYSIGTFVGVVRQDIIELIFKSGYELAIKRIKELNHQYKSTDLRRELIAFMNWWNVQDTGHACITITDLCDYDEYLQSRNETTKKK